MLEDFLQRDLLYKLDSIDLHILRELLSNDDFISFPVLVKRLRRRNVWDRGIIRRRIERLKKFKLIYFEEKAYPLIIESYQHKEKELGKIMELLTERLIR
jgi:hypothetical protein